MCEIHVDQFCTYCAGRGTIYRAGWLNSEDCPAEYCDGGVLRPTDASGCNPLDLDGGWYYTIDEGSPIGPFDTKAQALAAARGERV